MRTHPSSSGTSGSARRSFGYNRADRRRAARGGRGQLRGRLARAADLADSVERSRRTLARLSELEQLLATTLVSAEQAAAATSKEQARREAELIVAEAHAEARAITRAAQAERERLVAEARRIESLLRAALGISRTSRHRGECRSPQTPAEDWPRARAARVRPSARRRRRELEPPEPSRAAGRGRSASRARFACAKLDVGERLDQAPAARRRPGAARPASSAGTARPGRCASPRRPRAGGERRRSLRLLADDARRAARWRDDRGGPRRARQGRRADGLDGGRGRAAARAAPRERTPMSASTPTEFRTAARAGAGAHRRARSTTSTQENPGTLEDEIGRSARRHDNHLADTATATLDRELDYGLEEGAEQTLDADRRARSQRIDDGTLRHLRALRQADRRGAPRALPVGDALHRLPAARGARVSVAEPRRSRSTSASARRRTGSRRSRSPSARSRQARAVGSGSARSRSRPSSPTSSRSTSSRRSSALDERSHVLGPLSIHHVQNSGIAFGLFSQATAS